MGNRRLIIAMETKRLMGAMGKTFDGCNGDKTFDDCNGKDAFYGCDVMGHEGD